ncbi:MAG: prepilin-type N-terminal cleavage/methylation domain-containing protein [Planctomycetes bacterium]|nr:prepilin-type N-terminal cleavage/methylation domain-containing protein [Planctomycetota bacterium]
MSTASPLRTSRGARAGFTLAEVAVTLLIVGIGLTLVVQGLMNAKLQAANTHYRKLSRELALFTLGQLESGLFWEELDGGGSNGDTLSGTYAEEGHEDVSYEIVLGGEQFSEDQKSYDDKNSAYHDSWGYERERKQRAEDKDKDDEDQVEEPFEKVRIKVRYPRFGERENSFVLERWIPWEQVYGSKDGDTKAQAGTGEEQQK